MGFLCVGTVISVRGTIFFGCVSLIKTGRQGLFQTEWGNALEEIAFRLIEVLFDGHGVAEAEAFGGG